MAITHWVEKPEVDEEGFVDMADVDADTCATCKQVVGVYLAGDSDEITLFRAYAVTATGLHVCEDCAEEHEG